MVKFLLKAHQGIKGHVKDQNGNVLQGAKIKVIEGVEVGKPVVTSRRGEFWRILVPGQYKIKAAYKNLESKIVNVKVHENSVKIIDLIIDKSS